MIPPISVKLGRPGLARSRPARGVFGVESLEGRALMAGGFTAQNEILEVQMAAIQAHADIAAEVAVVRSTIANIRASAAATNAENRISIAFDRMSIINNSSTTTGGTATGGTVAAERADITLQQSNNRKVQQQERTYLNAENALLRQLGQQDRQISSQANAAIRGINRAKVAPTEATVQGQISTLTTALGSVSGGTGVLGTVATTDNANNTNFGTAPTIGTFGSGSFGTYYTSPPA